jgi:UDP-4-amino-4,6-dideoxy-N-acetyl-beta-L-altrosamine transaminase
MTDKFIPYGCQNISEEDINAVVDVLRSEFLTQGPVVPAFEQKVKDYVGVDHAVAVNSATSALHIACLALDLGKGDSLWTSSITFVASANCAIYCGANIDFIDIDPKTYNLCPVSLKSKLEKAERENKLPKIIVAVHLCGQSSDMKAIHDLSKKYGFHIIEDASHAIGGRYNNEQIGNCKYSDIAIFSFHPVKIITTGEGGMALTNSRKLYEKLLLLRSHGITRDPNQIINKSQGSWYYEQISLGYNYRMTDIHAALGISQLKRIDHFIASRHKIAERYDKLLKNLPLTIPYRDKNCISSYHLYIIRLDIKNIKSTHKLVFENLRKKKILVNLHYIPIHFHPFYKAMGFSLGDYPEAEKYYNEAISLPIYPELSTKDQDYIVKSIKESLHL